MDNYQEKVEYAGKWIEIRSIQHGTKKIEYIVRPSKVSKGGVGVIAQIKYKNKPNEILVIANYRPPINQFCLEFPAGLIDNEDSIEQNGLRELQEETGYHAQSYNIPIKHGSDTHKSIDIGYSFNVIIDGDAPENQIPKQELEPEENIIVLTFPFDKNLPQTIYKYAETHNYTLSVQMATFLMGIDLN